MLIAQLTDLHVAPSIPHAAANLELAIEHLNSSGMAIDAVMLTGDLVDAGTAEEYAALRPLLAQIEAPTWVLAGNHDDAARMRTDLTDYLPAEVADGHLSYVLDDHDLRLVALDTADLGNPAGVFPDDRAAWLDEALAASPRPTLVLMHHPAFECGIGWMDTLRLDRPDRFAEVIGAHPHVVGVASGHLHRSITTSIAHAPAVGAPSTCHQLQLDFGGQAAIVAEPPGYVVHFWNGNTLVSHTVTVGDYERAEVDLDFMS